MLVDIELIKNDMGKAFEMLRETGDSL